MDQTVLVRNDREIGAQVLEALHRAKVPFTIYDWVYIPELQEWQMIIATPWFDSKGPRASYTALVDAVTRAGIYERVPIRRIVLKSPTDPIVDAIKREAKEQNQEALHILKHGDEYTLLHAAITSARWRHFSNLDELEQFLSQNLRLGPRAIEDVLDKVKRIGSGSISPVTLSTREAKGLGLV